MRPQKQLIDRLTDALRRDDAILGAWLSGSLGKGEGDAFSDVDLLVAVRDADLAATIASWTRAAEADPETVYAKVVFGRVLNVVLDDWARYDLAFTTESELERRDPAGLQTLFQKTMAAPAGPPAARPAPADPEPIILEFIRVLGLLPLAMGREEYVLAQDGIGIMRRLLVDLMLSENAIVQSDRGGALKLNRFLTGEQRAALEALPPLAADREAIIAHNVALARAFLPRARKLADARALAWPQRFEDAARAHIERSLNVRI